ncbi:hypothetical protein [Sporosarcina sp. FSL K6-1508]|uniref:hypothetical protein n=1 Tax=Sporosarcina sp. FSL K6-1508 TaxID=2921553 RepID=UPI0030F859C3
MKSATRSASFFTINLYVELLNPVYKLSIGAYSVPVADTIRRTLIVSVTGQWLAEAIRLAAKLLGLWEATEKVLFL